MQGGAVEARRAHNPEVTGSNPVPATNIEICGRGAAFLSTMLATFSKSPPGHCLTRKDIRLVDAIATMPDSKQGIFQVHERLYQSGSPDTIHDWVEIWKHIDTVGSLWSESTPLLVTNKIVMQWEIEDGPLPDTGKLHAVASFLAFLHKQGDRVLIQCGAGSNRASLVMAEVLMVLTRCTGREAVRVICAAKPGALINATFRQYLEKL
jgi:hypothetical protein